MYDPIFRKSFSRAQRKTFGCWAIFLCFILALGISTTLKPHLHLISIIGDAVKMQLSISPGKNRLTVDDGNRGSIKPFVGNAVKYLQLPSEAAENKFILNAASSHLNNAKKKHSIKCKNSNYCELEGDIRIEGSTSTIFIPTSNPTTPRRSIEPYPRKGTSLVTNWTLHEHDHDNQIPNCTRNHTHPAILFSLGGFTGNFFHDFSDVLFPLFSTISHHRGEVHFLITNHKPWWINKYQNILKSLTKLDIINIDKEASDILCYNNLQLGLKFNKELIPPPSTPLMQDFKALLRQTYSLNRDTASIKGRRPRLMIVSRKKTRVITNEGALSRLAKRMGFEVVVGESWRNLSGFAETVNSCDVMVGVHGAGLTNMVFLPDEAVVVQVVPFGGVDGFARLDFGNPAAGMKVRYLEYKIGVKESSLRQEYSRDDPVLRHPEMYRKWDEVWSIYLNKQNVTLDLRRFKPVLAKALNLLRHS